MVWLRSMKPGIVFLQAVKKTLENTPPSRSALFEHTKRALLQASFYWNRATKKSRISANGGGKGNTRVFGCLTGQHTKMPVKLAPTSCTATAKGLAQETVNAVELESISLGCVNVKVDMWTMMIFRSIRYTSPQRCSTWYITAMFISWARTTSLC